MSTTQAYPQQTAFTRFQRVTTLPNSPTPGMYTLILMGLEHWLSVSTTCFISPGEMSMCTEQQTLLHPSPDHGEKSGKRNQDPASKQRTSGNITVLPENTVFHSRHRLPLPQPHEKRGFLLSGYQAYRIVRRAGQRSRSGLKDVFRWPVPCGRPSATMHGKWELRPHCSGSEMGVQSFFFSDAQRHYLQGD